MSASAVLEVRKANVRRMRSARGPGAWRRAARGALPLSGRGQSREQAEALNPRAPVQALNEAFVSSVACGEHLHSFDQQDA